MVPQTQTVHKSKELLLSCFLHVGLSPLGMETPGGLQAQLLLSGEFQEGVCAFISISGGLTDSTIPQAQETSQRVVYSFQLPILTSGQKARCPQIGCPLLWLAGWKFLDPGSHFWETETLAHHRDSLTLASSVLSLQTSSEDPELTSGSEAGRFQTKDVYVDKASSSSVLFFCRSGGSAQDLERAMFSYQVRDLPVCPCCSSSTSISSYFFFLLHGNTSWGLHLFPLHQLPKLCELENSPHIVTVSWSFYTLSLTDPGEKMEVVIERSAYSDQLTSWLMDGDG